jgi:hypothetical protein
MVIVGPERLIQYKILMTPSGTDLPPCSAVAQSTVPRRTKKLCFILAKCMCQENCL